MRLISTVVGWTLALTLTVVALGWSRPPTCLYGMSTGTCEDGCTAEVISSHVVCANHQTASGYCCPGICRIWWCYDAQHQNCDDPWGRSTWEGTGSATLGSCPVDWADGACGSSPNPVNCP